MLNKMIISFCVLLLGCSHKSIEPWIDYNSISTIKLGLSQKDVISALGEPILILSDLEFDDERVYFYYNYYVHHSSGNGSISTRKLVHNLNPERKTLLKFTFTEDALISWKEDKLTLSMAMTNRSKINPIFHYISLFLNVIFFVKIL